MSNGIWSAASGAVAQLRQLDVTANNVANASTLGFRGDTIAFREVLGQANSAEEIRHCKMDGVIANPNAGALIHTGRPMDVSLRTPGFMTVQTAGGVRYTRVGNFRLSPDGFLRTEQGHEVLGTDRKPIRFPAGAVESDIGFDEGGGVTLKGGRVAQLLVVSFENERGLAKTEGPLMRATQQSGPAVASSAKFEPGTLEGSNVSVVEGMVDIVNASRAFEACQKVMDAFKDVGRRGASSIMMPK